MPFCIECGTEYSKGKFCSVCGAEQVSAAQAALMNIERIGFVLHFDATESEINSFWARESLVDAFNAAFESVELSRYIDVDENYFTENGVLIETDPEFITPSSYFNLLDGVVNYSILNGFFEGNFSSGVQTNWESVRSNLLELRNKQFEPGEVWEDFTEAPVSISIQFIYLSKAEQPNSIRVNSRDALLTYLDKLEQKASTRSDVSDFLTYWSKEISDYRNGSCSKFMNSWFSAELLLTQTTLGYEVDEAKPHFLKPTFDVENFAWKRPEVLNVLVEADREESPESTFWFTPIPKNMFPGSSSFYNYYQEAIAIGATRDPEAAYFSPLRFALTMKALTQYEPSKMFFNQKFFDFAVFLNTYSGDLEKFIAVIDENFGWEDPTTQQGDKAEFINALELPENAEQIWEDYLKVIGVVD